MFTDTSSTPLSPPLQLDTVNSPPKVIVEYFPNESDGIVGSLSEIKSNKECATKSSLLLMENKDVVSNSISNNSPEKSKESVAVKSIEDNTLKEKYNIQQVGIALSNSSCLNYDEDLIDDSNRNPDYTANNSNVPISLGKFKCFYIIIQSVSLIRKDTKFT